MASINDKSRHILSRIRAGVKRGTQIGMVGGALLGIGAVMTSTAALTIPTLAIYGLGYALLGGAAGLGAGALGGGLRGIFSRVKPNGDAVIAEAEACAREHEAAAQEQAIEPLPEVTPEVLPAPAAVTTNGIPQEALTELQAMTESLNRIQENAESAEKPQPQAQAQPQAWQARVAQEQLQATDRQRG